MPPENHRHAHDGSRHEHHHSDHGLSDDEWAEHYVERHGDHPTNRMTVELAGLRPEDVVLDIGCGSGTAVREAAEKVPTGRVFGVDPSPAMLRIAREQTTSHPARDRIEFLEGEAGNLPLPDASITVALAINSLHHWNDPAEDLVEVLRVVVPEGRLLVADEETEDGTCGYGEGPLTDPEAVTRLIEDAGFIDAEVARHTEDDVKMFLISACRPPIKPPAEPRMDYEAWADWYDVFYSLADPAEVDFYVKLASQSGGPVLEIGVGTARIAIPTAAAGIDVVGVDLHGPMLARAREKLAEAGPLPGKVELVRADMRTLDLGDRRFPLVTIPANTLLLTTTPDGQRRTLRRAAAHLLPGGTLAFNAFVPDPELLAEGSQTPFLIGEAIHPVTGRHCRLSAVNRFDTRTQTNRGAQIAEELDDDGNVLRRVDLDVHIRYLYPAEAHTLIESAGLVVNRACGAFDRSPLAEHSGEMILLCHRAQ